MISMTEVKQSSTDLGSYQIDDAEIVERQLSFFRQGKAGCAFAAIAATNPAFFGWRHRVSHRVYDNLQREISEAVSANHVNMLSLLLPWVSTDHDLIGLVEALPQRTNIFVGMDEIFGNCRCVGLRLPIGSKESWITGMGPFEFLPVTRRASTTELIMRVKSRPNYAKVMKQAPTDVLHLADLDMRGIVDSLFKELWNLSLRNTARMLGHKPDLRAAAKTTFSFPIHRIDKI